MERITSSDKEMLPHSTVTRLKHATVEGGNNNLNHTLMLNWRFEATASIVMSNVLVLFWRLWSLFDKYTLFNLSNRTLRPMWMMFLIDKMKLLFLWKHSCAMIRQKGLSSNWVATLKPQELDENVNEKVEQIDIKYLMMPVEVSMDVYWIIFNTRNYKITRSYEWCLIVMGALDWN